MFERRLGPLRANSGFGKVLMQPSSGICPIAADPGHIDVQDSGGFVVSVAAKEFFFNNIRGGRVDFGQGVKSVVNNIQITPQ